MSEGCPIFFLPPHLIGSPESGCPPLLTRKCFGACCGSKGGTALPSSLWGRLRGVDRLKAQKCLLQPLRQAPLRIQ